jgi:hypothetical protein
MIRRHLLMQNVMSLRVSTNASWHVTTTALLGCPSHSPTVPSRLRCSGLRQVLELQSSQFLSLKPNYHSTSSDAVLAMWPNEYELIILKVIARGRTHRTINCHTFRLSEHYNYSSSTPGRRSRMILGVQFQEIGKGYYYYGSEVGRLCSTLCILSRFITMMYTGVAEGLFSAGILVCNAARDLQPYRLHREEWLASAPRPKPRCG